MHCYFARCRRCYNSIHEQDKIRYIHHLRNVLLVWCQSKEKITKNKIQHTNVHTHKSTLKLITTTNTNAEKTNKQTNIDGSILIVNDVKHK